MPGTRVHQRDARDGLDHPRQPGRRPAPRGDIGQLSIATATVHDQHLVGATDGTIAAVCQSELRTILTLDTDFDDIRTYPPQNYAGIIVLRIGRHDKPHVLDVMQRVILALATESSNSGSGSLTNNASGYASRMHDR
jgi:predicted nuclease of predicted toxin-antitoxin system